MPRIGKVMLMTLVFALALSESPAIAQSMSRGVLMSSTPLSGAPAGASAFRIRYQSRSVGGGRNQVTGVVILPDGPAPRGGRDVVASAIAMSFGASPRADMPRSGRGDMRRTMPRNCNLSASQRRRRPPTSKRISREAPTR